MESPLIFAADALVRFKGGRILIHTTSSKLPAFETDNPMLIGFLCRFAKPIRSDVAISALQASDRTVGMEIIEYLKRSGTLVEAGSSAALPPEDGEVMIRIKNHLRLLARSFYDTACDLLAFGPYADSELAKRSAAGVERRLLALLAGTDGLRTELGGLRQTHVARQLEALNVIVGAREHKLHIGCGKAVLDGWINIDVHPAPLSMNVLWGLPFADGSVRYIFVSHLLEHLFYPRDVKPFLAEVGRVLAPEGIVRFVVPDIEQCIEAYVNNDREFFGNRRETWTWWPENPTRLEDFLAYAGAGAEPAYLFESHKYGYDFETLSRVLSDAGFGSITRSDYMASAHPALRVDQASSVANAKYRNRYYSLFVEAQPRKSAS
ncbi:MAG: methyltransferase domain-containing protein [Pseudomonadota bacterium]|nr:methyltransferase domain-containing protein [Pseudomonadota bacterium]